MINALAPDGLIEGIEHPDYCFCLGLQWHPEFFISDADEAIFQHFIGAARTYHDTQNNRHTTR